MREHTVCLPAKSCLQGFFHQGTVAPIQGIQGVQDVQGIQGVQGVQGVQDFNAVCLVLIPDMLAYPNPWHITALCVAKVFRCFQESISR